MTKRRPDLPPLRCRDLVQSCMTNQPAWQLIDEVRQFDVEIEPIASAFLKVWPHEIVFSERAPRIDWNEVPDWVHWITFGVQGTCGGAKNQCTVMRMSDGFIAEPTTAPAASPLIGVTACLNNARFGDQHDLIP